MRDGFQVRGIDTRRYMAEMVELQTLTDGSAEGAIREDMGTALAEPPIAAADHAVADPNPAPTHRLKFHALLQSDRQSHRPSRTIGKGSPAPVAGTHCSGNHIICAGGLEIDHLVPRQLGGADTEANLWPQPLRQARLKDRAENRAHREVCDGRADLAEVQRQMARDWTVLYVDWFGPLP